jgi:hypothetical protein
MVPVGLAPPERSAESFKIVAVGPNVAELGLGVVDSVGVVRAPTGWATTNEVARLPTRPSTPTTGTNRIRAHPLRPISTPEAFLRKWM